MLLTERRSKQDPPPGVLFDALGGEQSIWWISVEGEKEPVVLSTDRPLSLTYASPFCWRPNDVVQLNIEPMGQGSLVHLQHFSEDPFHPMETSTIGHRWGEHIDRDLRERFDCGGRPDQYEVSLYRGDVEDWSIIDRVLDHSWKAIERIPVAVRGHDRWYWMFAGHDLFPGDVIWAGELGRHRSSVGCIALSPPELEARIGDGQEIFVPLPEFGRRLQILQE